MGFHPSRRSYSVSTNVSTKITNLPSGGGNKLQGIPPTIAYRNELLRHILREAYNPPLPRTIITCLNQIGGIGRNRSQFLPTADGTNSCKCITTNVYTFSNNLIPDPFFANVVNSHKSFWPYSNNTKNNTIKDAQYIDKNDPSIKDARYIDKGGPNSIGGTTYLQLAGPANSGNSWVESKAFIISPGKYVFSFSYKWLHLDELISATKSRWPETCSGYKNPRGVGYLPHNTSVKGITKYLCTNCCPDSACSNTKDCNKIPCSSSSSKNKNYGYFCVREYAGDPQPSSSVPADNIKNYVPQGYLKTWTIPVPPGPPSPPPQSPPVSFTRHPEAYPYVRIIYGKPTNLSSSHLTAPALLETKIDGYESSWTELSSEFSVNENTEVHILFWKNQKEFRKWQKGKIPAKIGEGNRYVIGFSNINLQKIEKNEWQPAPAAPGCERAVGENIFLFN